MFNYTLEVFKKDRRTKSGERLFRRYEYRDVSSQWMAEEVSSLSRTTHRPQDGWRLEWHPATVQVTNLQTGRPVEIAYEDVGTAQDPSQERYWSL
jgi:hypothetical protein